MSPSQLLAYDEESPITSVTLDADGKILLTEKHIAGGTWHANGNPSEMSGWAAKRDGSRAWNTFQLNAALVEWDLLTNEGKLLTTVNGFPFAMDVLEADSHGGLLVTGGDDRFVRVWSLKDFSQLRQLSVPFGIPQGAALMRDGQHVTYSYSTQEAPSEIITANIQTGDVKKLLTIKQPFVRVSSALGGFIYDTEHSLVLARASDGATVREFSVEEGIEHFAVSNNGCWLAVVDKKNKLHLFDVTSERHVRAQTAKVESVARLAVSDDGRAVYSTEWFAHLRRWNTKEDGQDDLGTIRGQVSAMRLSRDGSRLVIGGNHRDVGIYDTRTGKQLGEFRIAVSDFYITNVWTSGNRLIFTTDTGILFDGNLEKAMTSTR